MILLQFGLIDGWHVGLEGLPCVAPPEPLGAIHSSAPEQSEQIGAADILGTAPPQHAAVHGDKVGLEEARKNLNRLKLVMRVLPRRLSRDLMVAMRMTPPPSRPPTGWRRQILLRKLES